MIAYTVEIADAELDGVVIQVTPERTAPVHSITVKSLKDEPWVLALALDTLAAFITRCANEIRGKYENSQE